MPDIDTSTFHMVQLWLGARRLMALGRMLKLPLHRVDTNYLVHCALGELFQDQALKPFCIEDGPASLNGAAPNGRHVRVLGYANVDREALENIARGFASPTVYEICDWARCASKPMPDTFPAGMRLAFELRACPVVRKASAGEGPDGQRWTKGQELDAFLSEAWERPNDTLDREAVYRDWLARHLDARGGARVETVGMERFSIERMTRRVPKNGTRKAVALQRPDVTLTGTLTVTDADAFAALLRSGIGRHKSFGFGMLKVRRV